MGRAQAVTEKYSKTVLRAKLCMRCQPTISKLYIPPELLRIEFFRVYQSGYDSYAKVCELHFSDDAIRRYTEAYNEKTGENICVPLKRFGLQNFVVPTIFTDFPTYLSNSGNPARECSEQRLQRLENEHLQRSIQASIISKEEFQKKEIIYVVSRISRVFKCRGASGHMDCSL
ncbi:hypothetical protein TNCV_2061051 [Trichonephila clavipes]|nr:hypothetical protein TNCV_2061051 [Trichonephila clavipes]